MDFIELFIPGKRSMSWLMTKPTKWHVHPAKTRISLGIHPVWSVSSLCPLRIAKDLRLLRADSEDSDQTGRMPRLIWVFAGCTGHFVGFVMQGLKYETLFTWGDGWMTVHFYWCANSLDLSLIMRKHANNKDADQPAHLCSLISSFVVGCLDSIIPILVKSEISRLTRASLGSWFESYLVADPEGRFSREVALFFLFFYASWWNHGTSTISFYFNLDIWIWYFNRH